MCMFNPCSHEYSCLAPSTMNNYIIFHAKKLLVRSTSVGSYLLSNHIYIKQTVDPVQAALTRAA